MAVWQTVACYINNASHMSRSWCAAAGYESVSSTKFVFKICSRSPADNVAGMSIELARVLACRLTIDTLLCKSE